MHQLTDLRAGTSGPIPISTRPGRVICWTLRWCLQEYAVNVDEVGGLVADIGDGRMGH